MKFSVYFLKTVLFWYIWLWYYVVIISLYKSGLLNINLECVFCSSRDHPHRWTLNFSSVSVYKLWLKVNVFNLESVADGTISQPCPLGDSYYNDDGDGKSTQALFLGPLCLWILRTSNLNILASFIITTGFHFVQEKSHISWKSNAIIQLPVRSERKHSRSWYWFLYICAIWHFPASQTLVKAEFVSYFLSGLACSDLFFTVKTFSEL